MSEADLRSAAVGRLFRGMAHELANYLNNVTMNAELARLSPDDCAAALQTVSRNARAGGQLLKQLARFVAADQCQPQAQTKVVEAVDLARRLVASRARRENVALEVVIDDDLVAPIDATAIAIAVALLIDGLCTRASVVKVRAAAVSGQCVIALEHDADETCSGLPRQLADAVVGGHDGRFETTPGAIRLSVPC